MSNMKTTPLEIRKYINENVEGNTCNVCGDLICGLIDSRGYEWCAGYDEYSDETDLESIVKQASSIGDVEMALEEIAKRIPVSCMDNLFDILATTIYLCRWGELEELTTMEELVRLMTKYPMVNSRDYIWIIMKEDTEMALGHLEEVLKHRSELANVWFDEMGESFLPWLPREMLEEVVGWMDPFPIPEIY